MAVATELQAPWWMWALFVAIVLMLLAIDLLLFRGQRIGIRRSLWLTSGYIVAALLFGAGIYVVAGRDPALAFYTGYVLEKSLSFDNIFVFVVIFRTFQVPAEQQHRVLVWGVLSALVMRGLFIAAGVSLLRHYEWVMLIFGALLVVSGGRLLLQGGLQESDPRQSRAYRFAERHLRVTRQFHGRHFFTRENGQWVATPLFMTLLVLEFTDLMFAVDSIPAIFSVTRDAFIVFTSNVFALLGLRVLYFALAGTIERFRYLKSALALLLVVIGIKIFVSQFVDVPVWMTLAATLSVLAGGVGLSLVHRSRQRLARDAAW